MNKCFWYLKEIGQVFGVSHLTMQTRGIRVDAANPSVGVLTIGPGTQGAISLQCVRVGGRWAVPNAALHEVLRGLGALPGHQDEVVGDADNAAPSSAPKPRGRPRKGNRHGSAK